MKKYISVTARFDKDGNIMPVCVNWDDGRSFPIDRVTDLRYAASLKADAAGLRYKCRIKQKDKFIFLEKTAGLSKAKTRGGISPNIIKLSNRTLTKSGCPVF